MKTTVKHVGSVREWEGPIENWEAHVHEIKHWCDGGDVEHVNEKIVWTLTNQPKFFINSPVNWKYRIKQREPKTGEAWLGRGFPAIYMEDGHFLFVDGSITKNIEPFEYIAPSVESYYARKFLVESKVDLGNNANIGCLLSAVRKAAQLDH